MFGVWCTVTLLFSAALASPLSSSASIINEGAEVRSLYDHAAHARWLIHQADYGVATAHSTLKEGFPFGNVLSMSDGPDDDATGRIIFYVATMSQFAKDVAKDDRLSLTVSQEQAEGGTGCRLFDPEWPMCARVSVLGNAKKVPEKEEDEAALLMFARHPQMKAWSLLAHEWNFYELHVDHAYIIDWFGGYNAVSKDDYFAAKPSRPL